MRLRAVFVTPRDRSTSANPLGEQVALNLLSTDESVRGVTPRVTPGSVVDTKLYRCDAVCAMKTVNALELRQSLGKVLDRLEQDGGPIVVCRRRTPAAALVSLKDYRERFVDRAADEQRRDVVARLRQLKFKPPTTGTTLDVLRDLRS